MVHESRWQHVGDINIERWPITHVLYRHLINHDVPGLDGCYTNRQSVSDDRRHCLGSDQRRHSNSDRFRSDVVGIWVVGIVIRGVAWHPPVCLTVRDLCPGTVVSRSLGEVHKVNAWDRLRCNQDPIRRHECATAVDLGRNGCTKRTSGPIWNTERGGTCSRVVDHIRAITVRGFVLKSGRENVGKAHVVGRAASYIADGKPIHNNVVIKQRIHHPDARPTAQNVDDLLIYRQPRLDRSEWNIARIIVVRVLRDIDAVILGNVLPCSIQTHCLHPVRIDLTLLDIACNGGIEVKCERLPTQKRRRKIPGQYWARDSNWIVRRASARPSGSCVSQVQKAIRQRVRDVHVVCRALAYVLYR